MRDYFFANTMNNLIRIGLIVIFSVSMVYSFSAGVLAKGKPQRKCLVTCPDRPGKGGIKPLTPARYGSKPVTPPGRNK
jgi:hypothetical protein